jgi:sugar/nucleoside kinase (ribokinase family)
LSVDLGAATVVRTAGRRGFRETLHRLAPDIVFCTEDEERAIGGRLGRTTTWIVKLGARGVRIGAEHHPAATVDSVLDATGAGDAFAAGWIVGGTALALDAGARCVQQVGAMPSAPPLSPGNGCG